MIEETFMMIPSTIINDKDLSMSAKIFYGEILSLSRINGYCHATNQYFSEKFGLSEVQCSRIINELKNKLYVIITIKKIELTKTQRLIYPQIKIKRNQNK